MTLRTTVRVLVLIPVTLIVLVAAAGALARMTVRDAVGDMTTRVEPARSAAQELGTALVDQETGARGFVLTGDPRFLQPYDDGTVRAAAAEALLGGLLASDPAGRDALTRVGDAAARWRAEVAEPQIAARRAAAVTPAVTGAEALVGKELFDTVRSTVATLQGHLATRETASIAVVAAAQSRADLTAVLVAVVALLVAAVAPWVVRARLTRPLDRLADQTRAVADGADHLPIKVSGPWEIETIAADVDTMRTAMLGRRERVVSAELELAMRDARDRLAAEVHDNTVQRLFALGLALDAVAASEPRVRERLDPLVDELDEAMRELRALIFGLVRTSVTAATLREQVFDLTRDSARALGFTPTLEVRGDLAGALDDEAAVDLLTVLRESLSNVARHARARTAAVALVADDEHVSLRVSDDGIGMGLPATGDGRPRGQGLPSMADRAKRRGGHASVHSGEAIGTVVEWVVPRHDRDAVVPP
ncbi:CHASE3 domain-containing protein [Actinomycetospora chiangmaiensis]|uniref:CHASE3 domain-containing protein n=1 Tax=Actinomycetospora chiangmaiensis TaxID=402650 RepID=UPI00036F7E37|nr:CHASE3 domain-containing protein [Actinomycetospora chiangmaiensis]